MVTASIHPGFSMLPPPVAPTRCTSVGSGNQRLARYPWQIAGDSCEPVRSLPPAVGKTPQRDLNGQGSQVCNVRM